MADATNRPPVKTPQPQRDDLQKLIPDNVRLRRALEQLFIDVNQTLPDAVQQVGDNSQAVTEDVSMGVFGATDRAAARTLTWLSDVLGRTDQDKATIKRLSARVEWLESLIESKRDPVKPRQSAKVISGNAGGQTITSGVATTVTTWTTTLNTGSGFNSTSGVFTAPHAGQYIVECHMGLSGTTWAVGNVLQLVIRKNAANYALGTTVAHVALAGTLMATSVFSLVDLAASDTVDIQIFHNGTGNGTTSTALAALGNRLSITRVASGLF